MSELSPLSVQVWGDFACFTRPENKVERVSYPVMTPSAARGVLEAIFWKPEFRWRVQEIHVLRPIQYFSILRNEINSRQSVRSAQGWSRNGGGYTSTADRAQRHSLILREVAYVIVAGIELKPYTDAHPAKFRDQFRRRVQRGQYFSPPYLGNREFSASFAEPDGTEQPILMSGDFGRMLHDIDYHPDGSGRGAPRFFTATLENGVMRVPRPESLEGSLD